jgi:hypothetical protein
VKGTLIGEVLRALEDRATGQQNWAKSARKSIQELAKRVSWSRVGMAVAKGAVTMSWDPEKLLECDYLPFNGGRIELDGECPPRDEELL